MTNSRGETVRISSNDWIKLIGALLVHGGTLLGLYLKQQLDVEHRLTRLESHDVLLERIEGQIVMLGEQIANKQDKR